MSKHISRKERWQQENAKRYTSPLGAVVYEQQAWFGLLHYKTRARDEETTLPVWHERSQRLGPFKRPRNAMVALEQEATLLKNRHGNDLLLAGEIWAEV